MKSFCVLLASIISILVFSQERNTIKGKVYVMNDELFSTVYVKNITTNYTAVADISGNFLIQAKKDDYILFQAFNIQKRELRVTQKMEDQQSMTVYLDLEINEIPGIVIRPFKTYGSLELDVKRIPMMNETNKLLAKLKSLKPDKKYDGSTDLATEVEKVSKMKFGIEGILNSISGDAGKQERLSIYEKQMNDIKELREYYGDEYFNGLGLETYEINEFILFAYLKYDLQNYYQYKNYFQILNIFQKAITHFKDIKNNNNKVEDPKVGDKYFLEK